MARVSRDVASAISHRTMPEPRSEFVWVAHAFPIFNHRAKSQCWGSLLAQPSRPTFGNGVEAFARERALGPCHMRPTIGSLPRLRAL
jgi:hypothetical protein